MSLYNFGFPCGKCGCFGLGNNTILSRLKLLVLHESDISQCVHKIQVPNTSVLQSFQNFAVELTSP